jgi:hypothetical protein
VFLADYYVGWLRRLKFSGTSWALAPAVSGQPSPVNWAQDLEYVSDVIQGRDGGLYYVKQFSAGFGPGQIRRIIYSVATDVGSADPLPGDALRVTPNPGRAAAVREITFTLSRTAHAVLGVYSATGARLATVFDRVMDAGAHHVSWDGHDDRGSRVAPGVYLVRLELDGATTVTRKVAVLQ